MNTLARGLTAVGFLLVAAYAFNLYKRHPADAFCRGISPTETRDLIVARANAEGLFVNRFDNRTDSVSVFNQRAPWWRYACDVEFKDGKVSGKRVIAAD